MPTVEGVYYETAGEGAETVTFLGDVGFGPWQWAWQVPRLAGPFRTVVPTRRGCGRSADPPEAWDPLADLRAVWRDAGVERTGLIAAGLGSRLALRAARESGRVRRVALLGPCRDPAAFDARAMYADPADESAVRSSLAASLTAGFRDAQPAALDEIVSWRTREDADPAAFERTLESLLELDFEPLYEVTTEVLVLHGQDDRVCPAAEGSALAEALPRGTFAGVADAGHLVGCEAARLVTDRLFEFFGDPVE